VKRDVAPDRFDVYGIGQVRDLWHRVKHFADSLIDGAVPCCRAVTLQPKDMSGFARIAR